MKRFFSLKNIYFSLLVRIGIALLMVTLSRLLLPVFNPAHFSQADFGVWVKAVIFGLRFDLAVTVLFNSPYILMFLLPFRFRGAKGYQATAEGLFYLINSVLLIPNCVDLVFFRFNIKRSTFDILRAGMTGDDFGTLLPRYLLDYWYVSLVWLCLIALMVFLYRRTRVRPEFRMKPLPMFLIQTPVMALCLGLALLISRGGTQLRPISLITAGEYVPGQFVPLIVNTPFSIFTTLDKKELDTRLYMSNGQANQIHDWVKTPQPGKPFRKLNIVLIVLESFSAEYSALLNPEGIKSGGSGYTPFLDSLMSQGLCFRSAFANSKRSIEGIPSIIAGLPSLMDDAYITSAYSGNQIGSLALLLADEGYQSGFFHGGKNGTLNLDAFAEMAGFDKYYGMSEYGNDADYDGEWGIFDEEFLQYSAGEINHFDQPFVAVVYTLSSHHPYTIPDKHKGKFKKGPLEIHESIGYADYSLSRFFRTASAFPWFDSTLFVLTADHASLAQDAYYANSAGAYSIPCVFYMRGHSWPVFPDYTVQQADILPSVLDFIGYKRQYVSLGSSVFDTAAPHFSVTYNAGLYQIISDGFLLQFNGQEVMSMYSLHSDPFLWTNLAHKGLPEEKRLAGLLKALIQQYNYRMVYNCINRIN